MLKYLLHRSMHCSVISRFDQKNPEKTVNILSLVVLGIECIENILVKELGVYKDGQTLGRSFLPPKKLKQHPNYFVYEEFRGVSWSSGNNKYT